MTFKLKVLAFWAFLLVTWLLPPFSSYWEILDRNIFLILNTSVEGSPGVQQAFAWLNSRYADWVFEGVLIFIYLAAAYFQKSRIYLKALGTLILTIVLVQVFVNKIFLMKLLSIERMSPSLVIEHPVDLSVFKYLNNHVISYRSFPADHATTLFLCSFFSWRHYSFRVALPVTLICIFMILPRLISGAHWFTDVVFGAGLISCCSYMLVDALGFWKRGED